MKLPKLEELLKVRVNECLTEVSDADVVDYLMQQTTFEEKACWEQRIFNKIFALLYDYEERLNIAEENANALEEQCRNN